MSNNVRVTKFSMGLLVTTTGVLDLLTPRELSLTLSRHLRGDWGDVNEHDQKANDDSLIKGSRLLSSYRAKNGTKFWIITEADRSVTTILLPEEY